MGNFFPVSYVEVIINPFSYFIVTASIKILLKAPSTMGPGTHNSLA
jgi:hypothetical protein